MGAAEVVAALLLHKKAIYMQKQKDGDLSI